jgi:hypothetical protein
MYHNLHHFKGTNIRRSLTADTFKNKVTKGKRRHENGNECSVDDDFNE